MATIENTYTGDGSTTNFSFTFEYLEQSDVKASLGGTATTAFTFANATTLSFTTAPANGVAVRIFRDTNVDTLKATFFPGSAIKAEDLNNNFNQTNFSSQESKSLAAQAPTALSNANTAITTANSAAADATAALNAVNQVVSATTITNVAALAAFNTSGLSPQDQVAIFNSTGIENYNTTYPSAPQITGLPVGLVGASDVTVRLVWSGTGWTFGAYFSNDPDNRYYTQSVADTTFQAYDAGLAYLDGLNFTDETTFKQGVNLELGVDVQAYDADTTKNDVANTFTPAQTFTAASVHNGGLTVDGPYKQAVEAVSALDIDLSTGNYFTKTINANSTFTFSNPPASGTVGSFTLELTHTSGTVTWPTSVKFPADTAPTLTAGKTHLFMFVTDDGGTRYRGAALADYVN